jgi:hemerythrin superfamily protein
MFGVPYLLRSISVPRVFIPALFPLPTSSILIVSPRLFGDQSKLHEENNTNSKLTSSSTPYSSAGRESPQDYGASGNASTFDNLADRGITNPSNSNQPDDSTMNQPIQSASSTVSSVEHLPPSSIETSDSPLTEAIKSDHILIKRLLSLYESSHSSNEKREAIHSLVKLLSQHSSAEELLVYPLYELFSGSSINRLESLEEHQKIKNSLYELDQSDVNDPAFHQRFEAVKKATLNHIIHEETKFLPDFDQFQKKFPQIPNFQAAWKILKSAAPTRPHPSCPNTMPGIAIAGVATKMFDSIRDVTQGRK